MRGRLVILVPHLSVMALFFPSCKTDPSPGGDMIIFIVKIFEMVMAMVAGMATVKMGIVIQRRFCDEDDKENW